MLEAMASHGLAVDVAHASPRLLRALLAQEEPRIFCSHTGVAALGRGGAISTTPRSAIADRGGVVGIIFGTPVTRESATRGSGGPPRTAVRVAGEEAVCLGSDFDGLVPLPAGMRDVTDLWKLTAILLERGHPRTRISASSGSTSGASSPRSWGTSSDAEARRSATAIAPSTPDRGEVRSEEPSSAPARCHPLGFARATGHGSMPVCLQTVQSQCRQTRRTACGESTMLPRSRSTIRMSRRRQGNGSVPTRRTVPARARMASRVRAPPSSVSAASIASGRAGPSSLDQPIRDQRQPPGSRPAW